MKKTTKFYRFEGDNGELFYYDDDHISLDEAKIAAPPPLDHLLNAIEMQNK